MQPRVHTKGVARIREGLLGSDEVSYSAAVEPISCLVSNLHELNRAFLELLVEFASQGIWPVSGATLAEDVSRSLRRLSTAELATLAACPYSLFDLRFDDVQLWRGVFERPIEKFTCPFAIDTKSVALTSSVLSFAWHATRTDTTFARCSLGMAAPIATRFAKLSIFHVTEIVLPACCIISPRWSRHERFWPDLARFAAIDAPVQLQAAKLLGCQLLAAASLRQASAAPIAQRQVTHKK